MNRSYFFSIIIAVIAILLVASFSDAAGKAEIIAKDGQYVSYKNGIVYDEKTNLEWIAGPDGGTTWYEAKRWVENVPGGGWRMPTRAELKALYKKGAGSRNMTPLLKTTGWLVWSGETKDSSSAWGFYFDYGCERWPNRGCSGLGRGFAVRSRR
jgi:hypothetical protein